MKERTLDDGAGSWCRPGQFRRLSTAADGNWRVAAAPALTVHRIAGVEASTPLNERRTSVLLCAAPAATSGVGQLQRLQKLAHALGVRPQVLLRGTSATARAGRAIGWIVLDATPEAILRLQPDLAVIDDSSPVLVTLWVRLARMFEIPVATLRELAVRSTHALDNLGALPGWLPADSRAIDDFIDAPAARDANGQADAMPGRTLIALPGGGRRRTLGLRPMACTFPAAVVSGTAGLVA